MDGLRRSALKRYKRVVRIICNFTPSNSNSLQNLKMENQTEAGKALSGNELLIKMVISAWETYNSRMNKLVETLSEEQFLSETQVAYKKEFNIDAEVYEVNVVDGTHGEL